MTHFDKTHLMAVLQIEEEKDRLLRALADLENLRERSARQAETTRKFALQVSRRWEQLTCTFTVSHLALSCSAYNG